MPQSSAPNHLEQLRELLLQGRTWRYLRYAHFRDSLARVSGEVQSVCVAGAGHGYAELACAIEFPQVDFMITDVVARGYPNYQQAMSLAWQWGINNIRFSVWDVLKPTDRRFDLVASTEMLEHVPDVTSAARNMRDAAAKYIYCLVPFADDKTNSDPAKRQRAWERHQHYVYGFDEASLKSLFGENGQTAGAYWTDAGAPFREKLMTMTSDQIASQHSRLIEEARADLREDTPASLGEAAGIKILARRDDSVPDQPSLPTPYDLLSVPAS